MYAQKCVVLTNITCGWCQRIPWLQRICFHNYSRETILIRKVSCFFGVIQILPGYSASNYICLLNNEIYLKFFFSISSVCGWVRACAHVLPCAVCTSAYICNREQQGRFYDAKIPEWEILGWSLILRAKILQLSCKYELCLPCAVDEVFKGKNNLRIPST